MKSNAPILSIVVANYNYGKFLEEALCSVISQIGSSQKIESGEVEIIICDAASSDNSVEIIRKYACGLPPNTARDEWNLRTSVQSGNRTSIQTAITWWCSEKDGGQSAAFNKGFSHAHGKYLSWLNADDVMPAGCLKKIIGEMKRHPDCDWFTGNMYRFRQDGAITEIGWGPHWYPACLQTPHAPLVIFGPTTFFSRMIYERVGKIDESLHYIMDNDLWYRFMVAGIKQRRINCFCWGFRMHEESKTAQFGDHVLEQKVANKMKQERDYLLAKSGYTLSKPLRYFLLVLRIFDGSLIRKFWYQLTFKHLDREGIDR